MEDIRKEVDTTLIKKELTPERFLRKTNKAENEIYIIEAHDCPNIMTEIARLRELSFRTAGGGSGKSIDTDEYDTLPKPFKQLFVWDPKSEKILGGYRYLHGADVEMKDGQPLLPTSEMYRFSPKFIKEYLPYTIELGRSFVQPDYQSSKMGTKSLFALDNLWDGIGALTIKEKNLKYFFGKISIYSQYQAEARDLILGFVAKHFADTEGLIEPKDPFKIQYTEEYIQKMFPSNDFKENYKILNTEVRSRGVNIPPLVNAYIGLCPSIKFFGCAVFKEFGNLIELSLLIPIADIYEEKKSRHINSFLENRE